MKVYVKAAKRARYTLLYDYKDTVDKAVNIFIQNFVDSNSNVISLEYDSVVILKAYAANYARLSLWIGGEGEYIGNYPLVTVNTTDGGEVTTEFGIELRVKPSGYSILENGGSAEDFSKYLYMSDNTKSELDSIIQTGQSPDYYHRWD